VQGCQCRSREVWGVVHVWHRGQYSDAGVTHGQDGDTGKTSQADGGAGKMPQAGCRQRREAARELLLADRVRRVAQV
jgi:hypothetical protein